MDENLSWKYHITELTKKLSRTSAIFFKIRYLMHHDTLMCLYNSLFSSFLNYGITSWVPSYETHQKHLFLLQRKVLKCISFQCYCSPSLPIFHSLKVLTLKDIIHFNILNTRSEKIFSKMCKRRKMMYMCIINTSHTLLLLFWFK